MLLFIFGCSGSEKPSTPQDTAVEEEPLIICEDDDTHFSALQVNSTDIGTVFRVQWEASGDAHYLHYIDSVGAARWVEATSEGNQHSALAVGFQPLSEATLRPAVTQGETTYCGIGETVTVGGLSSELPQGAMVGEIQDGFLLAPITTANTRFATIVDGAGEFIWAHEVPYPEGFTEGSPLTQMHLNRDGQHISYFTFDSDNLDEAYFTEVTLDGTVVRQVQVPGWHLSFTEVGDGVFAGLGWDTYTRPDGTVVFGDTIVELGQDGTLTEVWSSFDAFPISDPIYDDPMVEDWVHVNYLDYDVERDKYLITIGRTNAAMQIDRSTGASDWLASGNPGFATDIRVEDERDWSFVLSYPHSVQWLGDDRILILNRSFPDIEFGMECSEVTELSLDLEQRLMRIEWSAPAEECLMVYFLGNALRLDDGNTLAVWSDRGQVDIFNPQSQSIWKLNLNLGAAFGFGGWTDSLIFVQ